MEQYLISSVNKTKKMPLGKQRGFVLLQTQHLKNYPQFFIHSYFCDCSSCMIFPEKSAHCLYYWEWALAYKVQWFIQPLTASATTSGWGLLPKDNFRQ